MIEEEAWSVGDDFFKIGTFPQEQTKAYLEPLMMATPGRLSALRDSR
jgi:hypothetical protein